MSAAPIIIKPESREAWLSERQKGIGSSEAAVIMGVSTFETPYALWERKRAAKAVESPESDKLLAGHLLEPAVARFFEIKTGRKVDDSTAGDWIAYDPERPWLRVSPDRLYFLDGGGKGILECKTTERFLTPDDVPPAYFCQVQYQLGVMGMTQATLAWLRNGYDYGQAEITFNPRFFELLTERIGTWWQRHIVDGEPPAPTTAEDVRRAFPHPEGDVVADEAAIAAVNELREVNARLKELEARKAELTDSVAKAIGNGERLVINDTAGGSAVLATYKAQESTRFDSARFKAEHPDEAEDYLKTSSTRVLRLK